METLPDDMIICIIVNIDPLYNYYLYQINKQFRRCIQYYYKNKLNLGRYNNLDLLSFMIGNVDWFDDKFYRKEYCILDSKRYLNKRQLLIHFDCHYSPYDLEDIIINACKDNELNVIIHIEKNHVLDCNYILQKAFLYNKRDIIKYVIEKATVYLNYTKCVYVAANAGKYILVHDFLDKCMYTEDAIYLAVVFIINNKEFLLEKLLKNMSLYTKDKKTLIKAVNRHCWDNKDNMLKIIGPV